MNLLFQLYAAGDVEHRAGASGPIFVSARVAVCPPLAITVYPEVSTFHNLFNVFDN